MAAKYNRLGASFIDTDVESVKQTIEVWRQYEGDNYPRTPEEFVRVAVRFFMAHPEAVLRWLAFVQDPKNDPEFVDWLASIDD